VYLGDPAECDQLVDPNFLPRQSGSCSDIRHLTGVAASGTGSRCDCGKAAAAVGGGKEVPAVAAAAAVAEQTVAAKTVAAVLAVATAAAAVVAARVADVGEASA
jgi:hypothetical protein